MPRLDWLDVEVRSKESACWSEQRAHISCERNSCEWHELMTMQETLPGCTHALRNHCALLLHVPLHLGFRYSLLGCASAMLGWGSAMLGGGAATLGWLFANLGWMSAIRGRISAMLGWGSAIRSWAGVPRFLAGCPRFLAGGPLFLAGCPLFLAGCLLCSAGVPRCSAGGSAIICDPVGSTCGRSFQALSSLLTRCMLARSCSASCVTPMTYLSSCTPTQHALYNHPFRHVNLPIHGFPLAPHAWFTLTMHLRTPCLQLPTTSGELQLSLPLVVVH